MANKRKITVKVPQSPAAAEADLRELGIARLQIENLDTELKEASQKLKQKSFDEAAPFVSKAEKLEAGLTSYAEARRTKLTNNNKLQTGKLGAGYFEWRKLPDKVSTKGIPKIIEVYAECKTFGFDTKILRKTIAVRKIEASERAEQTALIELYLDAVEG